MKDQALHGRIRRISDAGFRFMSLTMDIQDFLFPRHLDMRIRTFGIAEGMTVVDYGCGPGRFTIRYSRLVGDKGKVYAVDVHELAIEAVNKKIEKNKLGNVEPVLAVGYNSGLPDHIADLVTAIDMFPSVLEPVVFLNEIRRITKKDGFMIIDDGHQPRKTTKERILSSKFWEIIEETSDHMKCRPV